MSELWHGLEIHKSPLLAQGTFVWRRGSEVIGVSTADRREFLGMFGLAPEAPAGADNVIISPDDYLVLSEPHSESLPRPA